jgi:hypothetical protein
VNEFALDGEWSMVGVDQVGSESVEHGWGEALRGDFLGLDTPPRLRAVARCRADWDLVYELSKKLHRKAN